MTDWHVLAAIAGLGCATYAMRAGGYLAAGFLPAGGLGTRLLRLAPGNLFAAFVASGIYEGGGPCLTGSLGAILVMAITRKEWLAMLVGFAAAAAVSLV
jgi:uncharacterized membrane protein